MKRCLVPLLLSITCSLFAQDIGNVPESVLSVLDSFLSTEQRIELLKQGYLLRSVYNKDNALPRLVPLFAVPQTFAESWNKGNPTFLIEALYLHKKTEGSVKDVEKISRILRSVSKLEGLQYYSSSRKKMRTLYEKSYVIDDLKTEERVADPIDNPAADFSLYVLQKDLTFGKNVYCYRFCSDADSAGFISANVNVLKYSIFKAVKPENLEASIAVTDLGGYLLIHMLTRADFTAPSVFRERVQNSFRTRGEAVYGWFIAQYEDGLTF
jgi:hypothetical protein